MVEQEASQVGALVRDDPLRVWDGALADFGSYQQEVADFVGPPVPGPPAENGYELCKLAEDDDMVPLVPAVRALHSQLCSLFRALLQADGPFLQPPCEWNEAGREFELSVSWHALLPSRCGTA